MGTLVNTLPFNGGNLKAIEFPQQNTVIAKNQPEYLPLPAKLSGHEDGLMAVCYRLTFWEIVKLIFTRKLWIETLTFHRGVTPIRPSVHEPNWDEYGYEE